MKRVMESRTFSPCPGLLSPSGPEAEAEREGKAEAKRREKETWVASVRGLRRRTMKPYFLEGKE